MDYKSSGVDIDAGTLAVEKIKSHVKSTYTPNVLTSLGNFAAGFQLDLKGYENPVLVSCTDGVGTKVKLAIELDCFDTVGIDLVAMCVNDMICMGAKPLFFLDYIACHQLIPDQMEQLVKGMTDGCKLSKCALVGGEMAEMNDLYKKGDFDLAGFSVGIVDKDKVIDGSKIAAGQFLYGLASSGVHSNGYSLVRKALPLNKCKENGLDPKALLTPTKIYVSEILNLLEDGHSITGIAHITGGGLYENIERILPDGVNAEIKKDSWDRPKVFEVLQTVGEISEKEMYRVFNMGIGMVVISSKELQNSNLIPIGKITKGNKEIVIV
ncbi:phosphoribosylformylglycinamidine cyclo-ligase [Candidatus Marinamargulisbacteria bacterium SCGC AAA071-K20]|nr:phosphoribosylformylglycinamidine cyclo-ligase [Candidatus Marinamargulisbacteria bacterium SCGC AAA071-K20]